MAVAERRLREKEARKQQILDAAREVFFERGFDGTTVEEIAARTELSKGTIYLYFSSKEEIYFMLMHLGSRILHEMLKTAAEGDSPADTRLRKVARAYLEFYRKYPGYFRMLFLYYSSPELHQKISPELCDSCQSDATESLSLVAGIVEQGIKEELFRQCNPMDTALLLWACQNGIILLGERGDSEFLNLDTSIERLQGAFVESMIISLKSRS